MDEHLLSGIRSFKWTDIGRFLRGEHAGCVVRSGIAPEGFRFRQFPATSVASTISPELYTAIRGRIVRLGPCALDVLVPE